MIQLVNQRDTIIGNESKLGPLKIWDFSFIHYPEYNLSQNSFGQALPNKIKHRHFEKGSQIQKFQFLAYRLINTLLAKSLSW